MFQGPVVKSISTYPEIIQKYVYLQMCLYIFANICIHIEQYFSILGNISPNIYGIHQQRISLLHCSYAMFQGSVDKYSSWLGAVCWCNKLGKNVLLQYDALCTPWVDLKGGGWHLWRRRNNTLQQLLAFSSWDHQIRTYM